jgi:hypothetical protein
VGDIENDPQVQYLLPLLEACARHGARTLVTARDYGATYELLAARGVEYEAVGAAYGAGNAAMVRGLLGRTRALARSCAGASSRTCSSRPPEAASLSPRGARDSVVCDLGLRACESLPARWARATILHPDVIDSSAYLAAGLAGSVSAPSEASRRT